MMNRKGCSVCQPGCEKYEIYIPSQRSGCKVQSYVHYDYRTPDGFLFSTIAPTVEIARKRRDEWSNQAG